jgi:hypothetical protein
MAARAHADECQNGGHRLTRAEVANAVTEITI